MPSVPRFRPSIALLGLAGLLGTAFPFPAAAAARGDRIAQAEAAYEEAFAAAVEATAAGPQETGLLDPGIERIWSTPMSRAVELARERAEAAGEDPKGVDVAAVERSVAERFARLQPEAAVPRLLLALQLEDESEKGEAVLAVVDDHPGDPWAVVDALVTLWRSSQFDRAEAVGEAYLARHPDDPLGYAWMMQLRVVDVEYWRGLVDRWARATPGNADMVETWLALGMQREDPERTRSVLGEYFAREPGRVADLDACEQVVELAIDGFVAPARAGLERVANLPDEERESWHARTVLIGTATSDEERAETLREMEGESAAKRSALRLHAALEAKLPEGCDDALGLLASAYEIREPRGQYVTSDVAGLLSSCAERPAAGAILRMLLSQAMADSVGDLLAPWLERAASEEGVEPPAGAAEILERRLAEEAGSAALRSALVAVLRAAGNDERGFEQLARWYASDAAGFLASGFVADLARGWIERGETEAAVALLDRRLAAGFDVDLASLLWQAHGGPKGAERAARYAASLAAAEEDAVAQTGHVLAARGALVRGDVAAAEAHYRQALQRLPSSELSAEAVRRLGGDGDAEALAALAGRLCEAMRSAHSEPDWGFGCRTEALAGGGHREVAVGLLEARLREQDDEDPAGRSYLALAAQVLGEHELAERLYREVIERWPEMLLAWSLLGTLLAEQGRVDDLEALIERARQEKSQTPVKVLVYELETMKAAGEER